MPLRPRLGEIPNGAAMRAVVGDPPGNIAGRMARRAVMPGSTSEP